jgi:hypothetical protein
VVGTPGIPLDLAAQGMDRRLDRARPDPRDEAPDLAQELLAPDDPARASREVAEEVGFPAGEAQVAAAQRTDRDPASRPSPADRQGTALVLVGERRRL